MTAKEAAAIVCPDIGHPLDPNNEMQARAAEVIQQAIDAATAKLQERIDYLEAVLLEEGERE